MENLFVKNIREVIRNKKNLEKELNVRISVKGNIVAIDGKSLDEFEAAIIFDAISFGFSVKKALVLKNEDFVFRRVHIKEHTRRKLKDVKARLIGTHGKTKKTFSQISGCEILIGESEIGIISYVENVNNVKNALINIIRGSKQGNMYKYLEKMNRLKREYDPQPQLKNKK